MIGAGDWFTAPCEAWHPFVCYKGAATPKPTPAPAPPTPKPTPAPAPAPPPTPNGTVAVEARRLEGLEDPYDDADPYERICRPPKTKEDLNNWVVNQPLVALASTASRDGPEFLNDFAWMYWLGVLCAIPVVPLTACGAKYGWQADQAFQRGFNQIDRLDEPLNADANAETQARNLELRS
jgi:hypothetical protein